MIATGADTDTLPKRLLRNATNLSDRPALREKRRGIWHAISWAEMAAETETLAAALAARGVVRGARVALIGDNRPRLFCAMAAVQALGAVAMPLFQDATAAEIEGPLRDAGVTHAFAENQEQVDKLLELLPRCPDLRCIVYADDRSMGHYKQPQLVSHAALLDEGRAALARSPKAVRTEIDRGAAQDAAFLFFTSGASGPARGVIVSHRAMIDRAQVAARTEGLTEADVTIAFLPPGWMAQTLLGYVQPLVVGHCVCCPESSDTLLSDMREVAPTCFLTTPRMLDTIVSQVSLRLEDAGGLNLALYRRAVAVAQRVGGQRLSGRPVPLADRLAASVFEMLIYGPLRDALGMSRVRVAYSSGDAIDPSVLTFFRALGVNLKQLYGTTETGFCISMHRDGAVKPDTVGTPLDGVELSLTPSGEVLVRTPGLFSGYLGQGAPTLDADGRFHTGDIGRLDADGQLHLLDRAADIGRLADGSLYLPRPIENKIKFSPHVREAVTIGDGREHVCALIDINTAAVGRWADGHEIPYTGHADLSSREEVYGLIAEFLAGVNADLAADPELSHCRIRRFMLLPEELDADDGMLTRTGKLKRAAIAGKFAAQIAAMYAGETEAPFSFRGAAHGGSEAEVHSVKLRDAPAAPSQGRRAA